MDQKKSGEKLNSGPNTLVADLHADPRMKSPALNLLGVFFGFGALFLPFVIGLLVKAAGLQAILYATALLSLVPGAAFAKLAFPPSKHRIGLAMAEIARLTRNPLVLALGFLLFFESANEFIMGGYTSSYLTRDLHSSVSSASYLLAAWGAIMIGRTISSRLVLRWTPATMVLGSATGGASGVAILLAAHSLTLAAAGIVIVGLSFAGVYPITLGFAASRFEAYSGTVVGILFAMALVGGMALPWAVGQIAQADGLRTALAVVTGGCIMIFVLQMVISGIAAAGETADPGR